MLDIIVVTYNAKNKLKRCLESIERHAGNISHWLTIVDNASNDGTTDYLNKKYNKDRHVNIIHTKKNVGFSGAANIALKATRNKFVALIDDDAEVTKNCLEQLYKQIRNNPDVGIIGPKVLFPNKRICAAGTLIWGRIDMNIGSKEIDSGQRDYTKEVDALIGPCWIIRREIIRKVGYLDEQFFPCQWEDFDYCIRTRLAGYKIIYHGKAALIHHNLFRSSNADNQERFIRKWPDLSMFPLRAKNDGADANEKI